MKWINTAFKCRDAAEFCLSDLIGVSIKVGQIFLCDDRYYVPWLPFSESEYEIGAQVVAKHMGSIPPPLN